MEMWPSNMQFQGNADGKQPSPSGIMECPGWMCPCSPAEPPLHSVDEMSFAQAGDLANMSQAHQGVSHGAGIVYCPFTMNEFQANAFSE